MYGFCMALVNKLEQCHSQTEIYKDTSQGRIQDLVKGGSRIFLANFCQLRTAESCERCKPLLAGVQGLP